jgi:hypothetical protein
MAFICKESTFLADRRPDVSRCASGEFYVSDMKVELTAIGLFLGLSVGVGITLLQSETKMVDGRLQRVVSSVRRGYVSEIPIVTRCLWVGIPAAVAGAGIGYFAASGANLGAVFLGAVLFAAMSAGWRENLPQKFGRAGENAKLSDSLLNGLVGGLLGAAASVHWRKQEEEWKRRLPHPDAVEEV